MHRVLVPIDGSECAGRALDHALKLAKQIDGVELVLLHVQPEPTVYGEIQVYVPAERMQELQAKHSKNILNQAVEKTEPAGVAHACKTRTGDFATEIVRAADQDKCDEIVMGTRGMSAIGSLLMGSVVTKVVHLAGMPVTLVK